MISVIGSSMLLSSCSVFDLEAAPAATEKQADAKKTAPKVVKEFKVVEKGSVSATLLANGQIVPSRTVSMYFTNVSGPLSQLNYNVNDQVKKGDFFAEILPTEIESRIALQQLVVEKGKLRLEQLDDPSQLEELKKSIELAELELVFLKEQQTLQPEKNEAAIQKAQLAIEQFQIQMNETKRSKEQSKEQQQATIDKLNIRLTQIDNDIKAAKANMEAEQLNHDKLVGVWCNQECDKRIVEIENHQLVLQVYEGSRFYIPESNARLIKDSKLKLQQHKLSISNLEKNRLTAELDLELALNAQKQSNESFAQVESIQKSIDSAQLSLVDIGRTNVERVGSLQQDIQLKQARLEQLKLQLETTKRTLAGTKRQAELDQQTAELTLGQLQQNLSNSKLYSPADGIVSYLDNKSVTDIVSSGQLLARVADPNSLVFQMTAKDAKYMKDFRTGTVTVGTVKYEVELYTPQPGDSLDAGSNDTGANGLGTITVKFKKDSPELKFGEIIQVQLSVTKDDVLLVSKTDVRVENGKILVDVLKNEETVTVEVERGIETDTHVEVVAGLSQGDKVIRR
ncbi:hypothetical protein [Paenibacillus sp. YYML68]|uniref:hypothetical protein n=1 Tax=Paenibacillus sp. YYML68 TaxID=2909250 RepID=UPI0024904A55|nr:hypothetical protein [Paenibacillus sp. YYML68]